MPQTIPLPVPVPSLLTPSQLAAYLRIPVATIYQWRTRGVGPRGFKVGRHTRYSVADVRDWLEAQTGKADP